ncbi:LysR substrate-binding domain-containing protein [Rhizobium redzepovicii]|uniref:LysR substrate-binding domain-containing protein n=1 Tax=Rhizobium redzepovicii TaxID=2867518 RepID=A0AAW8P9X5_9HYPH|nr:MULTISPECIES: LysR substrate-binding domain-containing protein [Rhizobium]ULJ77938.1 LysR substrate-binding domain-containing protein [Rhizobium sp. C104]MBB3526557.1 DNA-binding transcriptional LysR family regulator [Rhizobium sp. BK456]MDF0662736.1 LysR substrate-binding domain-containing protein [Rhizobium sp. BC49]MDR9763191.1 LysR substrate-binding domain-containing protein [Rhizobium redzepovicii]MDR9780257.1 LysR substrate-binding domain-containing protein [Rhizobium redzepovicii]
MRRGKSSADEQEGVPKRGRLPPLSMVRAFEAVSRLGSMRRAADDLNLSHTVISRHVRNLEAWFGTRLVDAGPRGIRLTAEGRVFAETVGAAFDLIAKSTAELRPAVNRTVLRIWCVPGFATRWLTPRFNQLQLALPGIDFVMRATDLEPDFTRYEADIDIRYSEEPRGNVRWILLERPRMFPVTSPEWISRNAPIRTLDDLVRQPLIHEESRDQWRQWFRKAGFEHEVTLNGPRLWSANLTVDAAVAGQGIALATRLIAADDLRAGRLVELLETDVRLGGYYVVGPRERWNEVTSARFRAWLQQSIAETTGGHASNESGDPRQ